MSLKELQELISSKFDRNDVIKIVQAYSQLEEVNIKNIDISPVSAKGDSYLSTIVRVFIEAEGRKKPTVSDDTCTKFNDVQVPVFIKTLPSNVGRRKTFRSTEFFENEIIFYKKVWSELQKFVDSKNATSSFKVVPLFLSGYVEGDHGYIALEDLSYEGYKILSRDLGMDYQHASMVMKLYAKYHGVGYAYKQQNPNAFEVYSSLKETYFSEKQRKWYQNFQHNLIDITKDAVEKELPEIYSQKFNKLIEKDFFGLLCKLCEDRGPFSVITHGDAWAPNFLFRYDEQKKPVDTLLIDFQLARFTTLTTDLTFFLYTCTDQELREKHWDDLILQYYEAFCDTVKQLTTDSDIFTLDQLKAEIKRTGCFGIGMAIEAVVMSVLDDSQVSNLDAIEGDKEVPIESVWIVKPLDTPEKRKRLADTVKHAIDNGFIR